MKAEEACCDFYMNFGMFAYQQGSKTPFFKLDSGFGAHLSCSFLTLGRFCVCVSLTQVVIFTSIVFARARKRFVLGTLTGLITGLI